MNWRSRFIAVTVVLAAVALAVPVAPRTWETMAYQDLPLKDTYTSHDADQSTGVGYTIAAVGIDLGTVPPFKPLKVRQKRFAWMWGPERTVPDQVCPTCSVENHSFCFPRRMNKLKGWLADGTCVNVPESFRCTCPDPSHASD